MRVLMKMKILWPSKEKVKIQIYYEIKRKTVGKETFFFLELL